MCWQLCGEQNLPALAAEIAPDWDLPTEAVQDGLETLRSPSGTGAGRCCSAV